jgi:hypothetical protein
LGKSPLIDGLAKSGKINAEAISGKWESFIIVTVANPLPGIDRALVIAGSDKRGTIYGIYEISEQIGVSPWLLVGGCSATAPRKSLHQGRDLCPRSAGGEIPRHLCQRRGTVLWPLGA